MVQTGTEDDIDAFVALARPGLERALVARCGLHDGMDATSSAIEYAYREWPRLATMVNPVGYLYKVGQSSARRAQGRRHRLKVLVDDPVSVDTAVDLDLQRALMRLKPDQRVAVVLVHAHGHSYADAAALMDIPVTTVTNHVTRGLARLRQFLEDS